MSKILDENPTMLIALGFMVTAATGIILTVARRVRATTINALHTKTHVRPKDSESFSMSQAAMFPITGSCVLFGLYIAIKYVPKEWLTAIMLAYLSLASIGGMATAVKPYIGASIKIGSACVAVALLYIYTQNWILNNVMAFALCVVTMELVHLKSFATGALLLSGLFFYDIFWVFGTDVMVTVATNIQGPIKLLFPHNIFGDWEKKSLLGLGDIVIPGFFIITVLRMSLLRSNGKDESYYKIAMIAYVLSLFNTMAIMVFFNHAQPALLYIVPYLLISTMGLAAYRGEFKEIFWFDQEEFEKKRLEIESKQGSVTSEEENNNNKEQEEEEKPFLVELKQIVLSLFGQDDEYLEEIGVLKKKDKVLKKKE
jgi:minor histocompatibility antigen H13